MYKKNFDIKDLKVAIATKDYQTAERIFLALFEENPQDIAISVAAVPLFILLGDVDRALSVIESSLEKHPQERRLLYQQASLHVRKGNLQKSLLSFEKLYRDNPNDAAAVSTHITCLSRLQRFDEAMEMLELFEINNELNARVLYSKADMYIRLNNNALAKQFLEEYIANFPLTLPIHIQYASVLIKLGYCQAAIDHLEKYKGQYGDEPKFQTQLKNASIEIRRQAETQNHISHFDISQALTASDYVVCGDLALDFQTPEHGIPIYKEGVRKFKRYGLLKVRMVDALLRSGDITGAITIWRRRLNKENPDLLEVLMLQSAGQSYVSDARVARLMEKSDAITSRHIVGLSGPINRIALIGGSNTVMTRGWAPAFARLMGRFGIKVDNYGLGGISSLYGLSILKDKELFKNYDLVIFEYTLNDVYFHEIGGYSDKMIRSMVRELCASATEHKSRLMILELVTMDKIREAQNDSCTVANIYRSEAAKAGAYYFSVPDLIQKLNYSSSLLDALYTDSMHHTTMFATIITANIAKAIANLPVRDVTRHEEIILEPLSFSSIKLLKIDELCDTSVFSRNYRETAIIKDDFICVPKSGALTFRVNKGQMLLGLMINSSVATGYIKVTFGDNIFVKLISAIRPSADREKPRIFLRQFSTMLLATDDTIVEITPNVSEEDITKYPHDVTAYPAQSLSPLIEQELEISALLLA